MPKFRPINRSEASIPTIRRLPAYLQVVRQADQDGITVISGTTIAEELELEPIQVRKDLSVTGIIGKPRVGYVVVDLIAALEHFLQWDHMHNAIIVGAGNLGTALLGHSDFRKNGLNIIAAFDNDPSKVGTKHHGIIIRSSGELESFIKEYTIDLVILTVPPHAAQETSEELAQYGIKRIWNFTNVKIKLPEKFSDVLIQKENLISGYAVLSVGKKK
jgi:redox-sensing transcriptional repressor